MRKPNFNYKEARLPPPVPPPRDGSMSEESPYNLIHARANRPGSPASRHSKPKITSLKAPHIPPKPQRLNAPHIILNNPQTRIHQDGGFGIQRRESVTSPGDETYPRPNDQSSTPPAGDTAEHGRSSTSDASPLQDLYQLGQEEQRLQQGLSGLSLAPHAAEKQNYGGGLHTRIPVVPLSDLVQSGFLQQQQQQQQQQPPQQQDYGREKYAKALSSFEPRQKERRRQQMQQYTSQAQPSVIPQTRTVSFAQQQHPSSQVQQVALPQQQQRRPSQPSIRASVSRILVSDPATRGFSRATDDQQRYGGGGKVLSEISHSREAAPKLPGLESHSTESAATTQSRAMVDQRQVDSSTFESSEEQPKISKRGFSGTSVWLQSSLSPWRKSATPVRPSEVAADSAHEMLPRESLGPDVTSSREPDGRTILSTEVNVSDLSTIGMPPVPNAAVSVFAEVRGDLEQLQADIGDLSDGSNNSSGSRGSESETLILSEQRNYHTTNNVCEETEAGSDGPQESRTNNGETASLFNSSSAHKRPNLDGDKEDRTRAETAVSRKRNKLSSSRFICCFHNGPGRKCSGTDETISEVLKKLSEHHDTHVCDRCWVLKVKDESSGLIVHPSDDQAWLDHCLSPQCHRSSFTIGYRHLFDQTTCGTKTSRVRPGDSEAVFRFIFRLVHPGLYRPASVLTTEHSLHLDAVPRQSRRKLNREELIARANDLERRLETGEQENAVNALRITHLEKELAEAHLATARAEEKIAQLEKQTKRIVAMLSDALRNGVFLDSQDHQSFLRRVELDAPGALIHQPQPLLTPSASDRSRNFSATPARGDMAEPDPFSHPATREGSNYAAPPQAIPGNHTTDGNMSDPCANEPNLDRLWDDIFDEPGDSDITSSQPHRSDRWWAGWKHCSYETL